MAAHIALGRHITKSRLVTLLWPDEPEVEAGRKATNLHHGIVRALRNQGLSGHHFRDLAEAVGAQHLRIDALEFMSLTRSTVLADWLTALTLYRGDLLEDMDDTWVLSLRATMRDAYLHTLERASTALLNTNSPEATLLAQRWLRDDPLNDAACQLCMRALVACNRQAQALQEYVMFARRLQDELDINPLPETRALAEAIHADCAVSQHTRHRFGKFIGNGSMPGQVEGVDGMVVVPLASKRAVLGKRLESDDRVMVRLNVNLGEVDALVLNTEGKSALRRQRIIRLVQQAHAQNALMTDAELARLLNVNVRTIERDMACLRRAGFVAATRRRCAAMNRAQRGGEGTHSANTVSGPTGASAAAKNVGMACRPACNFARVLSVSFDTLSV
jgi:DNA-binding SARP family transcriptional activator